MIVRLSKPIIHGEDSLAEIELRDPIVDDVAELGYPFLVVSGDNGTGIELRPKVVLKYVSRLAAIPPSSLKTLSLGDLSALQNAVMGFFGEEAETSPT